MNPCLYHGRVRHTRYLPRHHSFRYRLFQFYLDLDEIESVLDSLWLCSSKRPAPVRFKRSDHLGGNDVDLKKAVQKKVLELGGPEIDGRICLLTNLRYWGVGFNPVSFYFCHDKENELKAILAEVNNTPWGEQHCYLIPVIEADTIIRHQQSKEFHVSPFMDLDMEYHWALTRPGQRLLVHIENQRGNERLFDAALIMKHEPLTNKNLLSLLASFPMVTLKVVSAIYYEAFRLWFKKIPFYPHSKPQEAPIEANK